jgi:hypothetical protein
MSKMKSFLPMVAITVIVLLIASFVEPIRSFVYGTLTNIGLGKGYNPGITTWKKAHPNG